MKKPGKVVGIAAEARDFPLEICTLLGYYAALTSSSVPTFRDNLSVISSRLSKSFLDFLTP
jgi:hypothetical protein